MNRRHPRLSLLTASMLACASLALAAGAVASPAQDTPQTTSMKPMQKQEMPSPNMHRKSMRWHRRMMGSHYMPGTVTSVDHSTGIVKLDSLGMHLVVHFPPPTIKNLKAGDKISLHLGYRIIKQ